MPYPSKRSNVDAAIHWAAGIKWAWVSIVMLMVECPGIVRMAFTFTPSANIMDALRCRRSWQVNALRHCGGPDLPPCPAVEAASPQRPAFAVREHERAS